jgi:hypothetical protein
MRVAASQLSQSRNGAVVGTVLALSVDILVMVSRLCRGLAAWSLCK